MATEAGQTRDRSFPAHRAGQAGSVLEGVALVPVGAVVARAVVPWAAATLDPARATRPDGALRAVAAEPYGGRVLTVVAVGPAAFAVYCPARARHPVGWNGAARPALCHADHLAGTVQCSGRSRP